MAHLAQRSLSLGRWRRLGTPLSLAVALSACHQNAPQAAGPSFTVEPRPFDVTIDVAGTISPAAFDEVEAPLDGSILSVEVAYGTKVAKGQTLFTMDTDELVQRVREAQSNLLKSQVADGEIKDWQKGADVARARRGLAASEAGIKSLDAKITTTKGLLDRGLVSRDEYQGLLDQRGAAELALASAQDDLSASLKKGDARAQDIARMDLLNARAKVDDLQSQLAHGRVLARASGVVIQPATAKTGDGTSGLHAGAHVQRGQLLAEIARTGDLAVTIKLDEADANKVREGMAATIRGPGFPGIILTGHVASLSSQAIAADGGAASGSGSGGGVSFPATVAIDPLSPEQARQVRMGMTAQVSITLSHSDRALVIPPEAVQGGPPVATVLVMDPHAKKALPRTVGIGGVAPDGVEVTSGLKPGELVTWSPQSPPRS